MPVAAGGWSKSRLSVDKHPYFLVHTLTNLIEAAVFSAQWLRFPLAPAPSVRLENAVHLQTGPAYFRPRLQRDISLRHSNGIFLFLVRHEPEREAQVKHAPAKITKL